MLKSNMRLNHLQIISTIGAFLSFIIYLIFPNSHFNYLASIFLTCMLGGNILYVNKRNAEGMTWFRKADQNFSKRITRKSSDTCLFLIIFQTFYYILPMIFLNSDKLVSNNILMITNYIVFIIVIIAVWKITDITNKKMQMIIANKK